LLVEFLNFTKQGINMTKQQKKAALKKLLIFKGHPFATKVYVCIKTGLPMDFVKKYWHLL